MKTWNKPEVDELDVKLTMTPKWDNKNHKGWCDLHKNPDTGVCTCGALGGSLVLDSQS